MRRNAWSLMSDKKAVSRSAPASFPPWPAQAVTVAANLSEDLQSHFAVFERMHVPRVGRHRYSGSVAPAATSAPPHFARTPRTRMAICSSVSVPPLSRKGRHQRLGPSRGHDAREFRVRNDCQKQRVVQRGRGAELTFGSVTARAILCKELLEIAHLAWALEVLERLATATTANSASSIAQHKLAKSGRKSNIDGER